ncbi:MBL fold metallo-hydrolase [Amnibacterium soli]|uniref:MBL fold metallo-hydrolase n=1 Tax=Amnibacterium soli TaxID=1282736 RepID=A0ABP8Z0C1_9MICO
MSRGATGSIERMGADGGVRRLRPVASGVLVATSRRDRTNTVVLLGPARTALLVDPAWTPDELDGLAADLDVLRLTVAAVVSTHSHFDHLLWHPRFGAAPRWGSAQTAAAARRPMLAELGTGYPASAFLTAPPLRPLTGPVPWRGTAVHPVVTDAHAPGHTSLWIPRGRVLLAGDLLSDVEVPLLADEDPAAAGYRAGLDALEPFAARAALVVPGHGNPGRDAGHRLRRDRRWLDALGTGTPPADDPRTVSEANRAAWEAALTMFR